MLEAGGLLVYSTSTIDYIENQGMIKQFLKLESCFSLEAFPSKMQTSISLDFSVEGMLQILPHHYQSDGFFIARMRKKQA